MILHFLSWLFPQVRRAYSEIGVLMIKTSTAKAEYAQLQRDLELITEARTNADRLNEYLRGQMEAQREQHANEIDSLKRMIDFFAPSVGGRTVFGLAPDRKVEPEEKQQPLGAQNRRSLSRAALDQFYREAEEQARTRQGIDPNPQGDQPADFSQKPQ